MHPGILLILLYENLLWECKFQADSSQPYLALVRLVLFYIYCELSFIRALFLLREIAPSRFACALRSSCSATNASINMDLSFLSFLYRLFKAAIVSSWSKCRYFIMPPPPEISLERLSCSSFSLRGVLKKT